MFATRYRGAALGAALSLLVHSPVAKAGGYDEMPDQGAQALGRGATFTAKADDATALYWNVAGLARQRGTKLQLSLNTYFNSQYFARSGAYPDDPKNPLTPWGGKPFPVAKSTANPFMIPMLVVTTDFGTFDRLTFGLGVFAPSGNGRTFPIGIAGKPAPTRYDSVQSDAALILPTIGAGYRVTRHLDIGVALHSVLASAKELTIAYADGGGGTCKNPEYISCDAEGRFDGEGASFTGSVGALARVSPSLQIGAQVRLPTALGLKGEVTSKLGTTDLKPEEATAKLEMPWIMRFGARYIGMNRTFEQYDLEIDGTFETWGGIKDPEVVTKDPTGATNSETRVASTHHWNNTFSVRAGGAYNMPFEDGVLSVRAGAFYDSPTTDNAYTRLDTNTMAKVAGTAGLGYKHGAFTINVAYAAVASISRTVTDGEIRPSNALKGGAPVDGNGKLMPAVNNGEYRAFTHALSASIEVNFEALFRERKPSFGDPEYEVVLPPSSSDPPPAPNGEDDEAKNKKKESPKEAAAEASTWASTIEGSGSSSSSSSSTASAASSASSSAATPSQESVEDDVIAAGTDKSPPEPKKLTPSSKKKSGKKNSTKAGKKSATR